MTEINVRSELSANVWKILVDLNAEVSEGDELAILESMKMEIPVTAPAGGKVLAISVAEGAAIKEGDVILTLGR